MSGRQMIDVAGAKAAKPKEPRELVKLVQIDPGLRAAALPPRPEDPILAGLRCIRAIKLAATKARG